MNYGRTRSAWSAPIRQAIILLVPVFFALGEWRLSGTLRKTFVFYPPATPILEPGFDAGPGTVEERMIPRGDSAEPAVRRYVEEALLGPASPELEPLFPPETRLRSFLLREGTVYLDLSGGAALAEDPWRSLLVLNQGIRRNFPGVREIDMFIEGTPAFYGTFREFFERKRGDENKTSETH